MGFAVHNHRFNDPRSSALQDLTAQSQMQLLGGLFSGDQQAAAASLMALAQMDPMQLMQLLRMMDPQLFVQLAMGLLGAAAMQNPQAMGGGNCVHMPRRNGASRRLQAPQGVPRAPSEQNIPADKLRGSTDGRYVPGAQVYRPGSPEAVGLFREAARLAGVPESWASSQALHNILSRESGGVVGRPNYTYGSRARDRSQWGSVHDELRSGRITARSSATGLGQLLLSNVDRYYPAGRAGIGDPVQEAAGMLRYIKARYGSPEVAWARYNTRHEGY